jgi:ribose transport system ATP-binding protein
MSVVISNISKAFGDNQVLRNVSMNVADGKMHALLGANGSGKSTMVKILTGIYQRDNGDILVGGAAVPKAVSPNQIKGYGVQVVHQETPLVQTLSVVENMALFGGYGGGALSRIRWKELKRHTVALFEELNIPVDPSRLAGDLTAAERALVSLAMALKNRDKKVDLLILDEADAAIPEDDAEVFLAIVKKIADTGVPVLIVTHRLRTVRQFCDDVTVLANSGVSMTGQVKDVTDEVLVEHILSQGRDAGSINEPLPKDGLTRLWNSQGLGSESVAPAGKMVLQVNKLSGQTLNGISFEMRAGEIVGVAGLITSGIAELPMILSGALQRKDGEIVVNGTQMARKYSPKKAHDNGIAMLPSDRLNEGGVRTLALDENMILPQFKSFWHRKRLREGVIAAGIDVFDIRPNNHKAQFASLSGGNQQKVLMAKWLLTRPAVLILNDPTNGVDPGARMRILAAMQEAADKGIAVLFLSTEPEQLASYCTRVLILKDGQISKQLSAEENSLSRENIARWCYS